MAGQVIYTQEALTAHPRLGQKWSSEEEERLISLLSSGKSVQEVASILERTCGGVQGRRKYIAVKMALAGSSVEQICSTTCLDAPAVEEAITEYHQKKIEKSVERKRAVAQPVVQPRDETLLSVMKEMRDLLRVIAQKL